MSRSCTVPHFSGWRAAQHVAPGAASTFLRNDGIGVLSWATDTAGRHITIASGPDASATATNLAGSTLNCVSETTLLSSAGSHTASTYFITAETAIPSAAQINPILLRACVFGGDGTADPTIAGAQFIVYP